MSSIRRLACVCWLLPAILGASCSQQLGGRMNQTLSKIDEEMAQSEIRTLDLVVRSYFVRHGHYPLSLDALCEKDDLTGLKYFEKDQLIDVWGRRIEYDVKGPRNGGLKPDIWSRGATGEEAMIGNWRQVGK
jgi:hypothetical protein